MEDYSSSWSWVLGGEKTLPSIQGEHGPGDNLLCLVCYMYVYEFIILCGYACYMYTCVSVLGAQKRVLDPWELELQSCEPPEVMVNQTAAHWKTSIPVPVVFSCCDKDHH